MKNHDKKKAQKPEAPWHTQPPKEQLVQMLKERGCRITRQRLVLLNIILEGECSSCKEIYYRAAKYGENIGLSTVYRMVGILEEIGAISRKNMYKVSYREPDGAAGAYTIEFEDGSIARLPAEKWNRIVDAGLRECGYGYTQGKVIRSVKQEKSRHNKAK